MPITKFPFRGTVKYLTGQFFMAVSIIPEEWRNYVNHVASYRNDIDEFSTIAMDQLERFEKGEVKNLKTVKTAIAAIKQRTDRETERDSYVFECINDIFRPAEDIKMNKLDQLSSTNDFVMKVFHYANKFHTRMIRLSNDLNSFNKSNPINIRPIDLSGKNDTTSK